MRECLCGRHRSSPIACLGNTLTFEKIYLNSSPKIKWNLRHPIIGPWVVEPKPSFSTSFVKSSMLGSASHGMLILVGLKPAPLMRNHNLRGTPCELEDGCEVAMVQCSCESAETGLIGLVKYSLDSFSKPLSSRNTAAASSITRSQA
jgi:hypothetical protein